MDKMYLSDEEKMKMRGLERHARVKTKILDKLYGQFLEDLIKEDEHFD